MASIVIIFSVDEEGSVYQAVLVGPGTNVQSPFRDCMNPSKANLESFKKSILTYR
jgi:hypothetical protein